MAGQWIKLYLSSEEKIIVRIVEFLEGRLWSGEQLN